jgi:hypothetical protein
MRRRRGSGPPAEGRSGEERQEGREEGRREERRAVQRELLVGKQRELLVVGLLLGLLLGCGLSSPWTEDLVDLLRGYRWNRLNRCIPEPPDYCRKPSDCDICSEVQGIDEVHVEDLSVELFEKMYSYSSRPLVVRNASLDWKIMQVLDYHWLKEQYTRDPDVMDRTSDDDECWFTQYKSSTSQYKTHELRNLRSVFRMPEQRVRMEAGEPWYVGWSVCHEEIAAEIFKLFPLPSFLHPESTPPDAPWIFIGTPGPGVPFHVDKVDMMSWQAQVRGVKTWYLRPPPECWAVCHGDMETTLYPGDIIIVNTNVWFHSTKVHGPELSISMVNEFD